MKTTRWTMALGIFGLVGVLTTARADLNETFGSPGPGGPNTVPGSGPGAGGAPNPPAGLTLGSAYTYNVRDNQGLLDAGNVAITTSPSNVHGLWVSYGDHTDGAGYMLVVNATGSAVDAATTYFYQATTTLTGGANVVSLWGRATYDGGTPGGNDPSPALLGFSFSLDGGSTFSPIQALTSGGSNAVPQSTAWVNYFSSFDAGAGGSVILRLYDLNNSSTGNDFAVDDITVAVPEPTTVVGGVAACALVAAGWMRRRRATTRIA